MIPSLSNGSKVAPGGFRRRFLFLALIMVSASLTVLIVTETLLYRHEIRAKLEMLRVTAQSQARMLEAVARHDLTMALEMDGPDPVREAYEATLSQVSDAHESYEGFGETGEFTLARIEGDSILFVLKHRHETLEVPSPVPFSSELAEPQRRALSGLSGTVVGLDYRGEVVLAAHEPVIGLELGIVAKIDLAEVRAPFVKAGLTAALVALVVVLMGTAVFFWIANPILKGLAAHSRLLEEEVEERRRTEWSLSRAQELAHLGSWEAHPISGSAVWSDELYKIHGLKPHEVELTQEFLRGLILPEDRPRFDRVGEEMLNRGRAEFEYRVVRTDGDIRWIRGEGEASFDQAGGLARMNGFAWDITRQKEIETDREALLKEMEEQVADRTSELAKRSAEAEDLNRAMLNLLQDSQEMNAQLTSKARELEASNLELDAFSYSVSHDLRAPLRHIQGFLGLLLKQEGDDLNPSSARYLKKIADSSDRMGRLIDDLLSLSRTGRTELSIREVDSGEVVGQARKVLSPWSHGRAITWLVSDLPTVRADPGLLRLVWENLISNAIKYTGPRSEARIEIGTVGEGDPGYVEPADGLGLGPGETVFFIRDNGVGFDPQYLHKLFGVFQRLHRDDEFEGTGIGLATVRRILHRHGGRCWAQGAIDGGAAFFFSLETGGWEEDES